MDLKQLLKEYFESNTLMQIATVAEGQPWLCNVYFVTDEQNNIYWTSARVRRHSKEIIANPIVAATVVHDEDKKQALQITGKAFEVAIDDAERIDALYSAKFGLKDRLTEVLADLPEGRAYWVLKPDTISFWDEINFPDAPKQEVKL